MLSPKQRNAFFKAVEQQKLNVRDFKIEQVQQGTIVTYKPTDFYFRLLPTEVKTDQGLFTYLNVYYTPLKRGAVFNKEKEAGATNVDSIDRVINPHFNTWLALLKEEFEQPDLWAELERTPLMFEEPEAITDEQFTPAEIKQLEDRLPQVERSISDLNLPPEAEAAITALVQEVPAKAKRLTKKELADTLVGSLMKEGIKWALTGEHISFVWHACLHFFTLLLPG